MKSSAFGKLVRLAKRSLEEDRNRGETEILVEKPVLPRVKKNGMEGLIARVSKCKKCKLGHSRIKAVFGTGDPKAALMFIGEGPGFDEDHKGEPFVGRAGQLLTKIIESIGMDRNEVYITNIVKCHPMVDPSDTEKRGNDRPPTEEEVDACRPYLEEQIELIAPEIICTLGSPASKTMLGINLGISKLRGKFYEFKGIKLMPTYHPAALLRDPSLKKDVWEDMKMIRDALKK